MPMHIEQELNATTVGCTIFIVTQWRLAQAMFFPVVSSAWCAFNNAQKSSQTGQVIQLVIPSSHDKPESAIYVRSLVPI